VKLQSAPLMNQDKNKADDFASSTHLPLLSFQPIEKTANFKNLTHSPQKEWI
jgi:hypothetical protein